jgi:hypothetical protein
VADSEGSSIRAVPLDPSQEVTTIVGTARLPTARLFTFGDRDGQGPDVLLQHPLGVVNVAGRLYLADTYNNKIKQLDPRTRTVTTIAGGGPLAAGDGGGGTFDEPAGISYAGGKLYVADTNHHRICTIDLAAGCRVSALDIAGLEPPAKGEGEPAATDFQGAEQVKLAPLAVRPTAGQISVKIRIDLPPGYKINSLAPQDVLVESPAASGPVDRAKFGKSFRREEPAAEFSFDLPVSGRGTDTLKVSTTYYYCQSGAEGVCKVGSVVWTLPLQISDKAVDTTVELSVEASP